MCVCARARAHAQDGGGVVASLAQHHQGDGPASSLGHVSMDKVKVTTVQTSCRAQPYLRLTGKKA